MKAVLFFLSLWAVTGTMAQPITRAEYFFDTDPGFGNGTAIAVTPGQVVDLNFNANTEGLSAGVHTLFIRTKSGVWSQVHTRLVGISPEAGITRAEYFTGTDPGYGNGMPITVTPGKLVMLDINLENLDLADGVNYIYFRTWAGFWSQTYAHEYCRNCTSILIQNITVQEGESRCYEEVGTIVTGGDGTYFHVESGATANLVAEQNVRMLAGTHFKHGSDVHVLIASGGTYCLNHMSKPASIVQQTDEQTEALPAFSDFYRIYPNPTSGVFTLELRDSGSWSQISVDVYNSIGKKMRHEEVTIHQRYDFNISDLPTGIYFIKVLRDGTFDMAKTMIKR